MWSSVRSLSPVISLNIRMSSPNMTISQPWERETLTRSFICTKNNSGPRIDPGEPQTKHEANWSAHYQEPHAVGNLISSFSPISREWTRHQILYKERIMGNTLKCFLNIKKKIQATFCCLSKIWCHLWTEVNNRITIERCFWKPIWASVSRPFKLR